jgi:CheY-like chemotaxis protein
MDRISLRPIRILLVEDNPADVRLTIEALKDAKVNNEIAVAQDGLEAMRMLRREGDHVDAFRPDIILLDLNLPRRSGHEVLAELKSDPALKRIPVVIMTSSDGEDDIMRSYDLHANCYVTKPLDLRQFSRVVQSLDDFWFSIVRLPGQA